MYKQADILIMLKHYQRVIEFICVVQQIFITVLTLLYALKISTLIPMVEEETILCEQVIQDEMIIDFENGCSTEMIVKTLKWLFIEQDIRYWNYSGRNMLWNAICEI